MNKPVIILYGAFDRYNYGDNLMPILLEHYFMQVNKDISEKYSIIYASIKESNLSRYACKPTQSIKNLLNVPNGSILIVVGGETMGANINGLYLHTFEKEIYYSFASFLLKYFKYFFTIFSFIIYPSPWIYPYIPNKSSFKSDVKIILNTVGGVPSNRAISNLKKIDYISVRDLRSYNSINKDFNVKLVPDSVMLLSRLFSLSDLENKISADLNDKFDFSKQYIVIQMCPYKASCTAEELARILTDIRDDYHLEPVLLPIGYASGHDDVVFLEQVKNAAQGELKLFYDLTIWDIAYFIANSKGFYGTSLHGVITAMSYQIPHFCINEKLGKLVSFLETWSIEPFFKPLHPNDIYNYINPKYDRLELNQKVILAQDSIEQHYDYIIGEFIEV